MLVIHGNFLFQAKVFYIMSSIKWSLFSQMEIAQGMPNYFVDIFSQIWTIYSNPVVQKIL